MFTLSPHGANTDPLLESEMSTKVYQLVRDTGAGPWANELFSAEEFLAAFEARGLKPTGTQAGQSSAD